MINTNMFKYLKKNIKIHQALFIFLSLWQDIHTLASNIDRLIDRQIDTLYIYIHIYRQVDIDIDRQIDRCRYI